MLSYHHQQQQQQQQQNRGGTLLDLGCGHGLIARALSPHFDAVVAIDPSAGMVAQARDMTFSSSSSSSSPNLAPLTTILPPPETSTRLMTAGAATEASFEPVAGVKRIALGALNVCCCECAFAAADPPVPGVHFIAPNVDTCGSTLEKLALFFA